MQSGKLHAPGREICPCVATDSTSIIILVQTCSVSVLLRHILLFSMHCNFNRGFNQSSRVSNCKVRALSFDESGKHSIKIKWGRFVSCTYPFVDRRRDIAPSGAQTQRRLRSRLDLQHTLRTAIRRTLSDSIPSRRHVPTPVRLVRADLPHLRSGAMHKPKAGAICRSLVELSQTGRFLSSTI